MDIGGAVTACVAGKLRRHFIRIIQGERVRVELSPHDRTRGRVAYRARH